MLRDLLAIPVIGIVALIFDRAARTVLLRLLPTDSSLEFLYYPISIVPVVAAGSAAGYFYFNIAYKQRVLLLAGLAFFLGAQRYILVDWGWVREVGFEKAEILSVLLFPIFSVLGGYANKLINRNKKDV